MSTATPQGATAQEKLKHESNAETDKRYADYLATGKTISWHEMRHNLENQIKK